MKSIQFQDFYESNYSNMGDTRSSDLNSEYVLYDFKEKDIDYNWIPLYYNFEEPWNYETHLKPNNLKSVTNDAKFVDTDDNESGSNNGVVRKYKKTRRGHAAGKWKRMQMPRRRGEKRLNVKEEQDSNIREVGINVIFTAKRAREEQDRNIREEQGNMAAVLGGLDVMRKPEAPEEEVRIY